MHAGKELLTHSKNGLAVSFDPIHSHAATHFSDTPQLRELVKEIIEKTVLADELMEFEIDMGRIVGTSDAVVNDADDKIIYAKRKNREVYVPFNKSKLPQPCSFVSVALQRQADGSYELPSAFIGRIDSPPFPGEKNEDPESKSYWTSHSLAWGTQEIQVGTETSRRPW